nr:nuclear transcription factor Y subunit B-6-like [Solanum lycopersicum]
MNNGYRVGSRKGRFRGRRSATPSLTLCTERGLRQAILLHPTNPSNLEDFICPFPEADRFMPIENVVRIMRNILPPHAMISDESKVAVQECISEFIGFVTDQANDDCQHEQRNTIMAEDLLSALKKIGFDDYIEPLTLYLHRYREVDGGADRSLKRESLLLKRPMVCPASGYSITPNHLPPNLDMNHPPPMGDDFMKEDASNTSTSRCTVSTVDNEVNSLAKGGKE